MNPGDIEAPPRGAAVAREERKKALAPFAAAHVLMVAERRIDGHLTQERLGHLEVALPVAFVAAAVDEVAGEEHEVGILGDHRAHDRRVNVVARAHVAEHHEAQRVIRRRWGMEFTGRFGGGGALRPAGDGGADPVAIGGAGGEAGEEYGVVSGERRALRTALLGERCPGRAIGHRDARRQVGVEEDARRAVKNVLEIGAADDSKAIGAVERDLGRRGAPWTGGADLDRQQVIARMEKAGPDRHHEALLLGTAPLVGERAFFAEAAPDHLHAVDPGDQSVVIFRAQGQRDQPSGLGTNVETTTDPQHIAGGRAVAGRASNRVVGPVATVGQPPPFIEVNGRETCRRAATQPAGVARREIVVFRRLRRRNERERHEGKANHRGILSFGKRCRKHGDRASAGRTPVNFSLTVSRSRRKTIAPGRRANAKHPCFSGRFAEFTLRRRGHIACCIDDRQHASP